jgi:large subunit ribosomal protein L25
MVEMFKIEAKAREKFGTHVAVRSRREGFVPCVMMHKKAKPVHLTIECRPFERAVTKGARLLDLAHPGGIDKVFIKEIQWDHLGERVIHVDFTKIAMDELLTLEVAVILKGKPVGVVEEGAALDHFIKMLKVECLPSAIPEHIEIDVTHLKKDESIKLKDIKAPPGVKLLADLELVIATVQEHKVEEVLPAGAAVGAAEPEVITAKKEEPVEGEAKDAKDKDKDAKEAKPGSVKDDRGGNREEKKKKKE